MGPFATGLAASLALAAGSPTLVCTLSDPRITESSGLVASTAHPGVLWTHNDSGDVSRIFAVGADGRTRSVYTLPVAPARDWETITSTKDSAGRTLLWVGDIGDNNSVRARGVLVHRVLEPATLKPTGTLQATSYRLVYEDGPHDAEAMFVGTDGRLRVVTKGLLGGGIYEAPAQLSTTQANVLRVVADAPSLVTDATPLPGGGYALRDYGSAYLYGPDGTLRQRLDLPAQEQGESLALAPDGASLLVGSEGRNSPVWRVALPAAVTRTPSGTPRTPTPGRSGSATGSATGSVAAGSARASSDSLPANRLAAASAALAALAVAFVATHRRAVRRRRGR